MKFPNGFTSWMETHHEVVAFFERRDTFDEGGIIQEIADSQGTVGLYELAREWTDEFERLNKGRKWDVDGDFFDEIKKFCEQKNKS
jgi:hypothetical protein